MRFSALLVAAALLSGRVSLAQDSRAPSPAAADLIFTHAVIYTGEGFAQDRPRTVDAMAIRDGKVIAVGSTQEILRLSGPRTRIRDVNTGQTGVYIFPGFDDAATRLGEAGRLKLGLNPARQAMTAGERRRGLELAIGEAVANGVTSVQDLSGWEDFLAAEQLEKEDKLDLRITENLPFQEPVADAERQRAHHPADDSMLHTGMLVGFLDGTRGPRRAAIEAPPTGSAWRPRSTQRELNRRTLERARAGFQIGFEAGGEDGMQMALDALSQPGIARTARNSIRPAGTVSPGEIRGFRRLGVIALIQPSHLPGERTGTPDGLDARGTAYPLKALLDAGVRLAFGSGYPREPISPYRGLYTAVTRANGARGDATEQPITRGQALCAYTQGPAYAEFAEMTKGKLEPGFDADFILVDRDLYRVRAAGLLKARTLETFVAGRQVFAAGMHLQ